LHRWLKRGLDIKFIRVDNAGENKKWEARCQSAAWKFPFKFEYTAARTPQQNSKVEVGFAVVANRGRTLMAAANVPGEVRRVIWNEAFKAATMLDGCSILSTRVMVPKWAGSNDAHSQKPYVSKDQDIRRLVAAAPAEGDEWHGQRRGSLTVELGEGET
jgi:hypothetical protein